MPSSSKNSTAIRAHQHLWLVGVVGLAGGGTLLALAPRLAGPARGLMLFAALHLVGALLVLMSGSYLASLRRRQRPAAGLDFGWAPGWMNGLGVAALLALGGALALQADAPQAWPGVWALLLLAASCVGGWGVVRSLRRTDAFALPMLPLLRGNADRVLDLGCGAGRTSVALAPLLGRGRMTGVDRFDAAYIEGGGHALLEHNWDKAGLNDRAEAVRADLTALPFADASFDSAVSTAAFDHLGSSKQAALGEVHRVLRPGGRFLMGVWVPSWSSFLVGNVLCLFLSSKAVWRAWAGQAGFKIVAEGVCNFSWFLLLEKTEVAHD